MKLIQALVGVGMLSLQLSASVASAAVSVTTLQEGFNFDHNMTGLNQGGVVAAVNVGTYSSGWMQDDPILGDTSGIWDLGGYGSVQFNFQAGLISATNVSRTITVRVVEWNDGGIYNAPCTVSMSGVTPASHSLNSTGLARANATSSIGGWVTHETSWQLSAGTPTPTVVVTSPANGGLIDSVAVSSALMIALPYPPLQMNSGAGQISLSWLDNGVNYQVETSVDLVNWTAVTATVVLDAGVKSVVLPNLEQHQFFRLK